MASKDSAIERIKRQLYGQGERLRRRRRSRLRKAQHDVPSAWQTDADAAAPDADTFYHGPGARNGQRQKNRQRAADGDTGGRSLVLWIVGGAAVFFVAASGVAAYVFFTDSNQLSTRKVDIAIAGPTSVKGGETAALDITVTNNNDQPLELADLLVNYPEGTRKAGELETELPRDRISLGTIAHGEQVTKTVRATLFGQSGSEKMIDVSVEYRLRDSNAIFVADGAYRLGITDAPLALSVEGLDETVTGQETEITLTVTSNAETVTENVIVTAEYPFGFAFSSASPSPTGNDATWTLGDVPPGESRTITVSGSLTGQEAEERVFRFAAGIAGESNPQEMGIAYVRNSLAMTVDQPFLALDFAINDQSEETVTVQANQKAEVDIEWRNTSGEQLVDTAFELQLNGEAFKPRSVTVENGFYDSNTNVIRWNPDRYDAFNAIPPDGHGTLSFSFVPRDTDAAGAPLDRPTVTLQGSLESNRSGSQQRTVETLSNSYERTLQVKSGIALTARTVYGVGPLANTGPVPPQAGERTTYSILWTASNGANQLAETTVTAQLPDYVTFTGDSDPAGADLSYNESQRTLTWEIGNLQRGARTNVAFQVAITPSVSQIGSAPAIVTDQQLSAFDRFVEEEVLSSSDAQTTDAPTDSTVDFGDGKVVQ